METTTIEGDTPLTEDEYTDIERKVEQLRKMVSGMSPEEEAYTIITEYNKPRKKPRLRDFNGDKYEFWKACSTERLIRVKFDRWIIDFSEKHFEELVAATLRHTEDFPVKITEEDIESTQRSIEFIHRVIPCSEQFDLEYARERIASYNRRSDADDQIDIDKYVKRGPNLRETK